jgi:hypothetical protein
MTVIIVFAGVFWCVIQFFCLITFGPDEESWLA